MSKPRIAILGAGPVGLEAALAAAEGEYPFTVYEAAPSAGGHVRSWGHVRMFTPWDMNVSPRMRRHVEAPAGAGCPTGRELAERLLDPLAELPNVRPNLRLGTRVLGLGREGLFKHEEIANAERARRPFRLLVSDGEREWTERADVVIDATGTYSHPNRLGDAGIPCPGERSLDGEIRRQIPDFAREASDWADKTVLVAGAGHSAKTAVRELAHLAREARRTRVIWALRRPEVTWENHDGDPLPERARLAAEAQFLASGSFASVEVRRGVAVEEIARAEGNRIAVTLRNSAGAKRVAVDRVVSLTGFVGDHELYRQLQVHERYATSGPIKLSTARPGTAAGDGLDQTGHGAETLMNPEPGFFILGIKSYGRHNTFLMRTGWDQVSEVFEALG